MKKLAPLLVVLAGVTWGCMGLFVRSLGSAGLSTIDIVAVRGYTAAALIGIYLLLFRRDMFRIRLKDLWCFLGTGIASVMFFNFCYFKTMTLTSLSVAAILLYTSPAFVMIMSRFLFGEAFTQRKLISLVLTIAGCIFVSGIVGSGQAVSGIGILFGLGSGLGYALYSIFGRYALERGYSSITITFYTFLTSSVAALFVTDFGSVTKAMKTPGGALLCLGIGIVCTIIPYTAYTAGLANMDNGKAAIIVAIEPVVATVISVVIYRERMDLFEGLGVLLVLAAIILVQLPGAKEKSNGESAEA